MSTSDKILILLAVDFEALMDLHDAKGGDLSFVSIALIGRKGLFDYSEEDLDSELEDRLDDLRELGETCDEVVAWAQESTPVQFVDVEKRDWKYKSDPAKRPAESEEGSR